HLGRKSLIVGNLDSRGNADMLHGLRLIDPPPNYQPEARIESKVERFRRHVEDKSVSQSSFYVRFVRHGRHGRRLLSFELERREQVA
ncbi:MAG TPA: hypothetical protein VLV83_11135, partial [Acidobacteriota bacterium]|nr:hypothetical protein [Acidobacteriota bacterium]